MASAPGQAPWAVGTLLGRRPGTGARPFPGRPTGSVPRRLLGAAGTDFPPTRIAVRVVRAESMSPYAQAPVRVEALSAAGARQAAGSGVTDDRGIWYGTLPSVPAGTAFLVSVEVPGGSGPATVQPGDFRELTVTVCAPGTPDLVCEAAEKRAYFSTQWTAASAAWGGPSGFAADQAHAALENALPPRNSRLAAHWAGELSWAFADPEIPPSDWPALLANYEQALAIFDEIPFPSVGGTDWFRRCAFGTPVWRAKDRRPLSLADFRIYSPTHSSFFPRSDRAIRVELAARYLLNIASIVDCIDHKFRKRLREVQRSAQALSTMGLAVAFVLGPIAGATGVANAVTELSTYAYANLGAHAELAAGGQTVADGILSGTEPGADLAVAAGLTALVTRLGRDADPRVAALARALVGPATRAVFGDAQSGLLADGATDVLSAQAAGSLAMTFAIRLLVSSIKAVGARSAREFRDIALSMRELPEDVTAFALWAADQLVLEALYDAAEGELAGEPVARAAGRGIGDLGKLGGAGMLAAVVGLGIMLS